MATTATTPLQRRGNRRAFMLAAVFGALAALLTLMYLRSAGGDPAAGTIITAPVLVAVRDIPERTVIKEGMVEVRQVPVETRLNLALTERQAAIGQLTRVPIVSGEQILRNKIADQIRDVGFSGTIPEGRRAVAVAVNEVVASGGHLGVGDYVDVIGVFEVFDPSDANRNTFASGQGDKPKTLMAVTILQNIQVLAVAQKSDPAIQTVAKSGDTKNAKAVDAKSVTLAVSPEQAEKLVLAEETGVLRLSLRPFGDEEQRKIAPVRNDLASIVGQ
jgi:pilus assembly protein CpaB